MRAAAEAQGGRPAPLPTVTEILQRAAGYLAGRGAPAARLDAELLLAHVLQLPRIRLYVEHDRPLTPEEVAVYRRAVARRARGEPVAYITGNKEFFGLTFRVSPATLVPRPETELLVEAALDWLDRHPGARRVADVGTGSGCIAVSLARFRPGLRVVATDICEAALAVATENAGRHGVRDRVVFLQGDLLTPLPGPVDAVVSNPPYVARGAWAGLPRDVRDFEPRVALDGGADGLAVIRRLVGQSARYLAAGGLLALEIGAGQEQAVRQAMREAGFQRVESRRDLAGHPRVVWGERG